MSSIYDPNKIYCRKKEYSVSFSTSSLRPGISTLTVTKFTTRDKVEKKDFITDDHKVVEKYAFEKGYLIEFQPKEN